MFSSYRHYRVRITVRVRILQYWDISSAHNMQTRHRCWSDIFTIAARTTWWLEQTIVLCNSWDDLVYSWQQASLVVLLPIIFSYCYDSTFKNISIRFCPFIYNFKLASKLRLPTYAFRLYIFHELLHQFYLQTMGNFCLLRVYATQMGIYMIRYQNNITISRVMKIWIYNKFWYIINIIYLNILEICQCI